MSIVNRRNALLGWTTWVLAKRVLKRKAKAAVPGTVEGSRRPNRSATLLSALAAGVGVLWFWRRRGDRHEDPLPAGRLGRRRPLALDAIHVFDAVPPALLPEQLVAEASRIADVPVALYVVDIDGSRLLRMAGAERLGDELAAPLAIGPELDRAGLTELRERLQEAGGVEVVPLWLRGRATGVMLTLGRPLRPLAELARQEIGRASCRERV